MTRSIPLVEDLLAQRRKVLAATKKLALLAALLLVADRLIDRFLHHGLDRYYGLDRPVTVACLGHSRTVLGIHRDLLQRQLGVPVSKYAVQGANTVDRFAMLRHLMAEHPESTRVVVFDVSAFTFNDDGLSSNSYRLFFPFLNEPEMGEHVRRSCQSAGELLLRSLLKSPRYNEETISLAIRGHLGLDSNLKRGRLDLAQLQRRITRGAFQKMQVQDEGLAVFNEMVRYARNHGALVVLAYIPTVDIVNNIDRAAHDVIVRFLDEYADHHPGVYFLDYNRRYESRHELFYDGIHLNPQGQELVTAELARDVQKILSNGTIRPPGRGYGASTFITPSTSPRLMNWWKMLTLKMSAR